MTLIVDRERGWGSLAEVLEGRGSESPDRLLEKPVVVDWGTSLEVEVHGEVGLVRLVVGVA